jgi:glycosyltransferase involved in cell wall biosynthesis
VLHFHGTPDANLFPGTRYLTRWFFSLVTSVCKKTILNTEGFRERMADLVNPSRSVALPNLVSCKNFKENGFPPGDMFNVLFVGRLSKSKGFWDLLDALIPLLSGRADIRLVCMGVPEEDEDAEMERIGAFLDGQGLRDKVDLLGRVPHGAQGSVFSRTHVFALPTRNDVFPVTLAEAMASGLPVVVTPQGAIPEIVDDGVNGFVVNEQAVEELREKIVFLADHREEARRMGELNRRIAHEQFDVDKRAEDLCSLYREVVTS